MFRDLHACDMFALRRGYDGKYKFGILPVSTFCSGHTFFTQRMHEKLKLQPYVVHATFQFSGTPGKRLRMREFMLWHVSGGLVRLIPVANNVCLDSTS